MQTEEQRIADILTQFDEPVRRALLELMPDIETTGVAGITEDRILAKNFGNGYTAIGRSDFSLRSEILTFVASVSGGFSVGGIVALTKLFLKFRSNSLQISDEQGQVLSALMSAPEYFLPELEIEKQLRMSFPHKPFESHKVREILESMEQITLPGSNSHFVERQEGNPIRWRVLNL